MLDPSGQAATERRGDGDAWIVGNQGDGMLFDVIERHGAARLAHDAQEDL